MMSNAYKEEKESVFEWFHRQVVGDLLGLFEVEDKDDHVTVTQPNWPEPGCKVVWCIQPNPWSGQGGREPGISVDMYLGTSRFRWYGKHKNRGLREIIERLQRAALAFNSDLDGGT